MSWTQRIKNSIREAVDEEEAGDEADATAGSAAPLELVQALKERLVTISDGKLVAENIDSSEHIVDFGYLDSISAVTFLAHIEGRYGVRIDDLELVERLNTLDSLAAHIHANR